MKTYTKRELNEYHTSLTYDDISLVPQEISELTSRKETNTETGFLGMDLKLPVVSSPMDTVTGIEMAKSLTAMGCLGITNRFDDSLKKLLLKNPVKDVHAVAVPLNVKDNVLEILAERKIMICIDTANAANSTVLNKCSEIKKKFDIKIIAGNIAHSSTLRDLVNSGADAVRIGIGGGSVCSTSIQTGIGIGQVSSLLDIYFTRKMNNYKIELIADGGIRNPGDVAKALSLGADVVMVGRMLAGTKETPGEVIKYADQLWKKYRGSASYGVKMKNEFIEGEETMIAYKGSVINVINAISDGLRSAMSYMNCKKLSELKEKDSFAILSNSSYLERLPKK